MHIAMLSPIARRTPPRHCGPWEHVTSLLTEGLVSLGIDVTLFATADSRTIGRLHAVCPRGYEEDHALIPKVWECLHISELFEDAEAYDIIHNQFDFLPLTYTRLTATPVVTTIRGFSSPGILPAYKKYDGSVGPAVRSRWLGNAFALLHPIHFDEPFGLSVIESMACGTPVIAFNRGSMPELIENGKNGFMVNNVEATIEALTRIKEIDRAACRSHVEQHFTVDRMVNEYIGTYEMILRERPA
jgi:hypothetical protein